MKPEILIPTKIFERTQAVLEKEFSCHRLYEATDRAAFLKPLAQRLRGYPSR